MERPILFSAPLVRAILEGRKTQTRRIVKPQPWPGIPFIGIDGMVATWRRDYGDDTSMMSLVRLSHGQPGDRLWVRETWGVGTRPDPHEGWRDGIEYRADQACIDEIEDLPLYSVKLPEGVELDDYASNGWRPSIHMPRWASRIDLEITGVRVELLRDISNEDARAEGVSEWDGDAPGDYRGAYRELWDSLYDGSGYGWDDNPWVFVYEFNRVKP